MKPKYYQVVLGHNTNPPKGVRLREEGLKLPYNLEKWNTSIFPCSIISPNFIRKLEITL